MAGASMLPSTIIGAYHGADVMRQHARRHAGAGGEQNGSSGGMASLSCHGQSGEAGRAGSLEIIHRGAASEQH